MVQRDNGCCPYCGRLQTAFTEPYRRCPGCNLFLREADLVPLGTPAALDDQSRDYCPWCGYPVAREHSLPEDEEFVCPGCSGTLTADMLETQTAIDRYRKRPLSGVGYLVFIVVVIAIMVATLLWIVP
jgi:hypothetical protein